MFRVTTLVNGEPLEGGKGFKPFAVRVVAERYAATLNQYAAANAPTLMTGGMSVSYVVLSDEAAECAR